MQNIRSTKAVILLTFVFVGASRVNANGQELPRLSVSDVTVSEGAPDSKDLAFYYWAGGTHSGFAPSDGSPIDWNGDGVFRADVCGDVSDNEPAAACGSLPVLQPSNDWLSHLSGTATVLDNLQLRYQCTANYRK